MPNAMVQSVLIIERLFGLFNRERTDLSLVKGTVFKRLRNNAVRILDVQDEQVQVEYQDSTQAWTCALPEI